MTGPPVYVRRFGQGFTLVIEARRGQAAGNIARSTYSAAGAAPDLQVLVSRDLGDGDPAVCEEDGRTAALRRRRISILRAAGGHCGDERPRLPCLRLPRSDAACTRSADSSDIIGPFETVADDSEIQSCIPIARPWFLPDGDTIIAARVRDVRGQFGDAREIVVRIDPSE